LLPDGDGLIVVMFFVPGGWSPSQPPGFPVKRFIFQKAS
jgi:hypothetical protein